MLGLVVAELYVYSVKLILMLTQETLKEWLYYDADTGVFKWAFSPSSKIRVGTLAGTVHSKGYRQIVLLGKRYQEHVLAWLYMTGAFPASEIDHKNRERGDNRWMNLRLSTRSLNMQNQTRARKDSRTGFLGVRKDGNRFMARIGLDGKRIYLGCFDTAEKAHAAYLAAKKEMHPGAIA